MFNYFNYFNYHILYYFIQAIGKIWSNATFHLKAFVPRRLFFAAQQRIAITWRPKYYKKICCFITRRNQKEYGPDVK
jgi:hypothetical protein